jgi:hypothetical protein
MAVGDHAQGCTGKLRYAAFSAARRVARYIRQRDEASRVHAYHCQHCHGFHVGEAPRRARGERPAPRSGRAA